MTRGIPIERCIGDNKNIKSKAKRCYALLATESEGSYTHAMPEL